MDALTRLRSRSSAYWVIPIESFHFYFIIVLFMDFRRRKFEHFLETILQQYPSDSLRVCMAKAKSSGKIFYTHSPNKSPSKVSKELSRSPGNDEATRKPSIASSTTSTMSSSTPDAAASDQWMSYDIFLKVSAMRTRYIT